MGLDPVTLLVTTVLLVGLAFAAQALLKPKSDSPVIDDKPSTLAQRGAYLPWLLGRRRLGSIFCWAGDRFVRQETISGGGKGRAFGGGSKPKQNVYYESAWHAICVGPAYRLHRIYQDGAIIWEGPIDSASHPSGSSVLTSDGSFQIYWGQEFQPVNTYLGSGGRVVDENGTAIQSRWPFICYIVWRDKRLGTSARWPLIDYDIEARVSDMSWAASGPAWFESTLSLTGVPVSIIGGSDGTPGTARVRLFGQWDAYFRAGYYLRLAGNSGPVNGDYKILSVLYTPGRYIPGYPPGTWWALLSGEYTDIWLDQTVSGLTISGTVQPLTPAEDDGVNPAHAAAMLLFGKHPHGLGLNPADFDLTTLDDLSQICVDEGLSCSLVAQGGDTAEAMLGALMSDIGFIIPWDTARGKYVFRTIRLEQPGAVVAIDPDIILPPNPEIQIIHGEKAIDKLVYVFADRTRNFRDMTIQIDDDSQGTLLGQQRLQKVQIPTAISYAVAQRVAERRAPQELTGGSAIGFKFNRGARLLVPGTAFTVPGYPGTYRVERCAIEDSLSGEVQVSAVLDVFGSKPSTFEQGGAGGAPPAASVPQQDLACTFIELPSHVSPDVERIIVPRIRANAQIVAADIWLSRDDVTYQHYGQDSSVYTGGTLNADFAAETFQYLAQGPVITALGPDIATVLDLSGDLTSWGAGRQLVVIEEEVFYLQKVTALGGNQYRLDGLMRARFDSQRALHLAGSVVFIFQNDVQQIEHSLLSPGQTLYVKPQPKTSISIALSLVSPVQKTLVGKGIAPMEVEVLAAGDRTLPAFVPSNSWPTGGGALLKWAYRSTELARSGAGLQGYGKPAGVSAVQGRFQIKIKTTGDVLKKTYTTSTPSLDYPQASIVADFGSEPAAFKAEVANINGGLVGPSKTITVTRI